MMELLRDHISKGYNFVVITGNPWVGAPQGCENALDVLVEACALGRRASPVPALCSLLAAALTLKDLPSGMHTSRHTDQLLWAKMLQVLHHQCFV